jgi:putrescine transport system substrate-binding protein
MSANSAPGLMTRMLAMALIVAACGQRAPPPIAPTAGAAGIANNSSPADEERILNVYNWFDYIDPSIVPAFEKEYGIRVNYDVFDANDVLETKLLAGKTGYDIVVPSAEFLQRQIPAGVYRKLDKTLLPNLKNLDQRLSQSVEMNDPGNLYSVIYFWGTLGVGYNQQLIATAMADAPVDSYAMLYDPNVVRHFKDCGVLILDQPEEVVATVLVYLGRNPNEESLADLAAAEKVLLAIRPYVRYIDSSKDVDGLANGEICLALTFNGDIGQARARA